MLAGERELSRFRLDRFPLARKHFEISDKLREAHQSARGSLSRSKALAERCASAHTHAARGLRATTSSGCTAMSTVDMDSLAFRPLLAATTTTAHGSARSGPVGRPLAWIFLTISSPEPTDLSCGACTIVLLAPIALSHRATVDAGGREYAAATKYASSTTLRRYEACSDARKRLSPGVLRCFQSRLLHLEWTTVFEARMLAECPQSSVWRTRVVHSNYLCHSSEPPDYSYDTPFRECLIQ